MEREIRHQCLIYSGPPSQQLPALTAVIQRKLEEGHRCVYLNSRPMVAGIRSSLAAAGVDVVGEMHKSRLVLTSERVLSADGSFDVDLMLTKLEDALDQALADGHKGLWATGDMTWEFGPKGDFSKLLEYEWQLENLFRRRPNLGGICQYNQDTLSRDVMRQGLATHRAVFINQTLSRINPHYLGPGLFQSKVPTNAELDEMLAAVCQPQATESI